MQQPWLTPPEQENPALNLGLMSEGSSYRVVTLPDGKPLPGFPNPGTLGPVGQNPGRGTLPRRQAGGPDAAPAEPRRPSGWVHRPETQTRWTAFRPFYSSDSGQAPYPDGRVVEVATGKELANITPVSACPRPSCSFVDYAGDQLVAAFSHPCH